VQVPAATMLPKTAATMLPKTAVQLLQAVQSQPKAAPRMLAILLRIVRGFPMEDRNIVVIRLRGPAIT